MAAGRDLDPPRRRAVRPLRAPDPGRRAHDARRWSCATAGRSRSSRCRTAAGRLRRADRARRHDLHPPLGDAHVRRELRLREGSFRLSLSPRAAGAAAAADRRPRRTRSRRPRAAALPPSPQTVSAHVVEALGRRRDACACGRHPSRSSAGGSAAASCRPALRPRPRCGCSPAGDRGERARCHPERCVDPDDLFARARAARHHVRGRDDPERSARVTRSDVVPPRSRRTSTASR